mmetsp:Transcript_93715/g.205126  ORF Transcript_93715/g.205126 Transcript_93715/m.205126 type:complete len:370 (+) Transcript_93715:235-1344(+)
MPLLSERRVHSISLSTERISTPTNRLPPFIWSSQFDVNLELCTTCSTKSWLVGVAETSPTNVLKWTFSRFSASVTTLSLTCPRRGPSASCSSNLIFCSRIVRPAMSPQSGATMSLSSFNPAALKKGETKCRPIYSLNLFFALSILHSTRATIPDARSFSLTTRPSGWIACRPELERACAVAVVAAACGAAAGADGAGAFAAAVACFAAYFVVAACSVADAAPAAAAVAAVAAAAAAEVFAVLMGTTAPRLGVWWAEPVELLLALALGGRKPGGGTKDASPAAAAAFCARRSKVPNSGAVFIRFARLARRGAAALELEAAEGGKKPSALVLFKLLLWRSLLQCSLPPVGASASTAEEEEASSSSASSGLA